MLEQYLGKLAYVVSVLGEVFCGELVDYGNDDYMVDGHYFTDEDIAYVEGDMNADGITIRLS